MGYCIRRKQSAHRPRYPNDEEVMPMISNLGQHAAASLLSHE